VPLYPNNAVFASTDNQGMVQRDYVAIAALQGLLAHYGNESQPVTLTRLAYEYADALIAASSETTEGKKA
jgi:hypothetical protein